MYECPDGSGRFAAVHVVPESVSATGVAEFVVDPTAMHAVAAVHETSAIPNDECPEEIGRLVAVHVVPERVSATGVPYVPALSLPTATHAVDEVHETPLRSTTVAPDPDGNGRFVALQVVPESVSATGTPWRSTPSATQAVDDVHETASRYVLVSPDGSGRLLTLHAPPDNVSATGVSEMKPLISPTAMHIEDDGHETPRSLMGMVEEESGKLTACAVVLALALVVTTRSRSNAALATLPTMRS